MSVRIENHMPQAQAMIKQKLGIGLRSAVEDVHRIAKPKTPKKHGDLANMVTKQVLGLKGAIQWTRGYAVYQERGYSSGPITRYTTGGTGAHFAENAVKQVANNPGKYFK